MTNTDVYVFTTIGVIYSVLFIVYLCDKYTRQEHTSFKKAYKQYKKYGGYDRHQTVLRCLSLWPNKDRSVCRETIWIKVSNDIDKLENLRDIKDSWSFIYVREVNPITGSVSVVHSKEALDDVELLFCDEWRNTEKGKFCLVGSTEFDEFLNNCRKRFEEEIE